ncbi:MAG: thioredoxin family protein [Desulfuromonadaceae bacterium]|nr:thioredoxin family protein [Desulfuromonadaceae bacterium]
MKMKIEVIMTHGRKVSRTFLGNAFEAIKACGMHGKVVVVNDLQAILKYGIKSTPTLVINGVVVIAGNLLSQDEIIKALQQHLSSFTS